MKREVDRFAAHGDDGKHYEVVVFQDFTDARSFGGGGAMLPGRKMARLSTGEELNRIGEDEFQIPGRPVIIRRTTTR